MLFFYCRNTHLSEDLSNKGSGCTNVGELFSAREECGDEVRFETNSIAPPLTTIPAPVDPMQSTEASGPFYTNTSVMTQNSYLVSQAVLTQTRKVKWHIKDRTHLYLTGEPLTVEPDSKDSDTDVSQQLKVALTDLAISRPPERCTPGGAVPARGSHLSQIHTVIVNSVNWSDFTAELPRIRTLLPEMKVSVIQLFNVDFMFLRCYSFKAVFPIF